MTPDWTGFIGSNLADTLASLVLDIPSCGRSHLAQNHDVVISDNLATGRREKSNSSSTTVG
ncbi:MAG TPA: hypothetical protein PKJ46_10685 [Methanoculleus sp.]|jgi:nucleoside-diphosphate-sugar epimerase|nr:hypothetical protein [Methanolinea sp.]HNV39614.1 hypothetical protein [Methanoculleus sp.]